MMTMREYCDRHIDYLNRKTAEMQSKPRQKTYLVTYGIDEDQTKTVRAANKKDAAWLANVPHIVSITAI